MRRWEATWVAGIVALAALTASGSWGTRALPAVDDALPTGWPVELTQLVVVLVYSSSGLAKLRFGGVAWLQPESFQRWTFVKLDRMPEPSVLGPWIGEHPALAFATAAGILAPQLSIVGVLVWSRFRPVGIVAFHVVSWVALDLQLLLMAALAWLPLVDWEGWRRRLGWPQRAPERRSSVSVRSDPATSSRPADVATQQSP